MKLFRVLCTAIVICTINQSSTGRSLERTKRNAEEDVEQETQSYTDDAEGTTAIDRRFITMNQDNHFNVVVQNSHDFSAHYDDNEDKTSSEIIAGNNNDINELLSKFNKGGVYPSGMHWSNVNGMKSSNLQDMLQSMMNENGEQLDEQSIKNIMSMISDQENVGGSQLSFQKPSFNWGSYKPNMAGSSGNTVSVDLESIIQMLTQQYDIGAEQKELLISQMKHMDTEQLQQLLNMLMFGGANGGTNFQQSQVIMNDGSVTPQFDGSQITMSQDEMAGLLAMLKEKGYNQDSPNSPIQIEQSQLEELLKMIKLKMKANGEDGKMSWNTEQTNDVKHQIDIQVSDESSENTDAGHMDMEQLMKLIMSLQGGEDKMSQLNIDPRILQMLMKLLAGLPKSPAGLPKEIAVKLNPDLLKYLMHMLKNKPKQKHSLEEPENAGDEMNKILQLLQSGKPQYKQPMQAEVEPVAGEPSQDDILKFLQMLGPKAKDKVIQIRLPGYDKPAPVEIDWDTNKILHIMQSNPQILQSIPQNGKIPDWLLNLLKNMKKKPYGSKPENYPQQEIGPQDNEQHVDTDTNSPDQMPKFGDILKLFNKPKKPNFKQPFYNKDENLPFTNTDEKQPDLSDIWKLLKSFGTTPAPSSKYPNSMPSTGKKHRLPSNPKQPEENDANLPVSDKTPDLSSLLKDLFNFDFDNDKKTSPRPRPNNWPKPGPGSVPFRPGKGQPKYPNQPDKNPQEDEENLPMGHSPDNSSGGFSYGLQESTIDEDEENLPLQHLTENTPINHPYGPQDPHKPKRDESLLSQIFDFLNPKDPEENEENLPLDHFTEDTRPYRPRYPEETTKRPSLSQIFLKLLKPKDSPNEDDDNLPMTQSTEEPDNTRPLYPVESTTQPNLTNLILTLLNPTYNPEEDATTESVDDWYPATTKKPSLSDIFAIFNPARNKRPNNRPGYRPNDHPTPTHDPSSPDFFNPLNIYNPEGEEPEDNGDYQRVLHKTTHVIKIINMTREQPMEANKPRFPERDVYIAHNTPSLKDSPEQPDADADHNTNILKEIFNNLNFDRFNRTIPLVPKPTKIPQPIRPSIPFKPPSKPPSTTNLLNTIMQYLIDNNKYEINDFTTKQPIVLPVPTIKPDRNPLNISPYTSLGPPNRPTKIDVYFPHYKDPTIIAPYETEAIDDKGRPVSPEWLPQIDKAVYLANKFFPNRVTDVIFMSESSNDKVGFIPSILKLIRSSVSGDSTPYEPKDALVKNPKRYTLLKRLVKIIFSSSLPSKDRPEYPEEGPFLIRLVKHLVIASFPEDVQPTKPPRGDTDPNKPSSLFDRNITNLQHLGSPLDVLRDFLKLPSDPGASDPLQDEEKPRRPSLVTIILSILRSNSPMDDYPSKPSPLWPFDPKRPSIYGLSLTKTIINLLRSEFLTANPQEESPWSPSYSKPKDESILDQLLPLLDSNVPSGDKNEHPFLSGDPEEDPLQPSRTRKPSILNYLLPLLDSSIPSTDKNKYPFPKDSPFDELFNPDRPRPSLLESVMNMLLKSSDSNSPSHSSSDWPNLWHPRPRPDKEPNDRHKSMLYYILLLLQSSLKPLEGGILKHIKESLSPRDPLNSLDDLWPENWSPKLIPDTALPMWERFTQLTSYVPTALTGLLSMLYSSSPSTDPWTSTPSKPNLGGLIPSSGSTYDPENTNRPSLSDDQSPGTDPKEKPSNWLEEIISTLSVLGARASKIQKPSDLVEHTLWPLNISYLTRDPSDLKPHDDLLSILDSSTLSEGKKNDRLPSWFPDPNKKPKDRRDKPRTTLDYLLPLFDSSIPSSIMDDYPYNGENKKPKSIPSRIIKTILSISILQSVIPGSTPDSNNLNSLTRYILPSSLNKFFDISKLPETDLPDSPNKRPDSLSKRPSLTREILSILNSDPSDDSTPKSPEFGIRENPLRHFWKSIQDVSNYLFSNPTKEPRDKHPHPILDLLRSVDPFGIFNWPLDKPDSIASKDRERNPLFPKYDPYLPKPKDSILKRILNLLRSSDPESPLKQAGQPKDPFDKFNWPRIKPGNMPSRDRERYPLLKRPSFTRTILSILLSNPEPSNSLDPFSPSNQRPDYNPTNRTRPSFTDEILSFLISNPNRDDPISVPSRDRQRYPILPKYGPYLPKPTDSILKRILDLLRSSDSGSPSKQDRQPEGSFDIFSWPRDKPDPLLPTYDSKKKKRPSFITGILSILLSNPEPSNWLNPLSPSSQRPDSKPTDRTRPSFTDEILSFLVSNPYRDDPVSIPSRDRERYPILPKYDPDLPKPIDSIMKRILYLLRSSGPESSSKQPEDIFSIFNWPLDKPDSIPFRDKERYPIFLKYDTDILKPTDSILKRILVLLRSSDPESPSKQDGQPEDSFDIFSWPRDKPDPLLPTYDSKNNKRPSFIRTILSILLSNPEPANWLDPLSPSNQRPGSKTTDRTRPLLTDEILSFLVSNPNRDDPISMPSRGRERYPLLPKYDPDLPKPIDSIIKRILNLLRSSDPEYPSKQPEDPFGIFSWPRDKPDPLLSKYDQRNKKRPSYIRTILSILLSNPEPDNWLDPLSPSNQRPNSKPADRTRPSLTDEILSFLVSNPNRDDPISMPSRGRERYPLLPKYDPDLPKPIDSIMKRILNLLRSSDPEYPSKQPEDPFGIFSWPRDKFDPLLPKYDPRNKKRPSFVRTILSILLSNPKPDNWLDPLSPSNQRPNSKATDRTRPSLMDAILLFLVSNPSRDDPIPKPSLENTFDFPKTSRKPSLFRDILTVFDSSRILPDDLLPGRDKKYPELKPSLPTIHDFPKREKKPSLFSDILSLFDSSKPSTDKDRRPSSILDILTSLHSNPNRDKHLFPSPDFSWFPEWLRPTKGDKLYGQITFGKISEICNKLMKIPSAITNIFGPLDDNIDPLKNLLKPSSSATEKKDSIFPSWHELFAVSVGDQTAIDLFKPELENTLFPSKPDSAGTSKNPFKELKDLFKLPDPTESKKSFSLSKTVLKFLTKLTTDPWSLKDDDDIKSDSRLISLIQKISILNISDRRKIFDCLRLKTMLPTLIASEKEEIDCDLVKLLMKLKFPKLSEAEINNLIAQQVSNHLQEMTNRRTHALEFIDQSS